MSMSMVSVLLLFIFGGLCASGDDTITEICSQSSISNGTTLSILSLRNQITDCTLGSLTLTGGSTVGRFEVKSSTVEEGSSLKVSFTSEVRFELLLTSTVFMRDARLIIEGRLQMGTLLWIEKSRFDIRTPMNGAIIAIDLRGLAIMERHGTVLIQNIKITISANEEATETGLVAGIAMSPTKAVSDNLLQFYSNTITFNNTAVKSYGLYCDVAEATVLSIDFSGNKITQVGSFGSQQLVAFFLSVPPSPTISSMQRLFVKGNTVDGLYGFLQVTAQAPNVDILDNTHTYLGPSTDYVAITALSDYALQIKRNVFTTVFDPSNPSSSRGNPVLIVSLANITKDSIVILRDNELHASSFTAIPFLFPSSTNLLAFSSMSVTNNYFLTNSLSPTTLPMASFAISPNFANRSVDLGIVYLCSNVWPAEFQVPGDVSVTVPSRVPVRGSGSLDQLVASADRPLNVSIAGGDCPDYYETRRPNNSLRSDLLIWMIVFIVSITSIANFVD